MDSGEVRPLLEYASWLLDMVDPRNVPRGMAQPAAAPTLDEVVRSLLAVPHVESSALLTAVAVLSRRDDLRARVADEVRRRGHVFPRWLAELHRSEAADRAVQVTEPLQDGYELLVGVTVPGGFPLSVAAFIDNNLNSAVKSALVAPRALDVATREIHAAADDPDLVFAPISPADARAHILDGIEAGELASSLARRRGSRRRRPRSGRRAAPQQRAGRPRRRPRARTPDDGVRPGPGP